MLKKLTLALLQASTRGAGIMIMGILLLLAAVHPLIHNFEGGSLDMIIDQMNMCAAFLLNSDPVRSD